MDSELTLQQINQNIQHRCVRDLAWALLQPCFFNELGDEPSEYLQTTWHDNHLPSWLSQLDHNPSNLLKHLKEQRATRLGIYFEQLLSFYFANYPRFRLVAKNLQANSAQRTIGEYDFIIWDQYDQQHYHVEVAVKFYVGFPTIETEIANNIALHNWHQWVGPNKKDTLSIKMQHLTHHQLQLSQTEAGKSALNTIGLDPEQLTPKLLLTGRLYLPYHAQNTQALYPRYIHHSPTEFSYWLSIDELTHSTSVIQADHDYIVLPRQLWMAEINSTDIKQYDLERIPGTHITAYVTAKMQEDDTPLHIAEIKHDGRQQIETQRFFLLS